MLSHLWQERARPPGLSRAWGKAWAKRLATGPALAAILWRVSCLRARGARVGVGVFVARAHISGQLGLLEVGAESFIGRVTMQVTAPLRIGSRVCINDGVKLLTATHDVQDGSWPTVSRPITVGDYAWIATDATILSGVTIGRGAVVGASAVVTKDVPDYGVAVGNPARILDNQRAPVLDYSPTRLLAVVGAWLGNYQPPPPH